jgi:hypothetical protein
VRLDKDALDKPALHRDASPLTKYEPKIHRIETIGHHAEHIVQRSASGWTQPDNSPQNLSEERTMRKLTVLGCICVLLASPTLFAQVNKVIHEFLTGYSEVPLSLSTTGNGEFQARISNDETQIQYRLSYSDLEADVTQAHIHLGSPSQAGGISVFLCTNLGNGPAGTQACPAAPATITGTIQAADVIGPAAQGITAGQLAELISAIRAGATYVNVHSTLYPVGEIRSQIDSHGNH